MTCTCVLTLVGQYRPQANLHSLNGRLSHQSIRFAVALILCHDVSISPFHPICSTPILDYNDGTGRDIYLSGHLSKIPSTGKANFSERPPSKQASKRHVRTDMLPPFTPSGSGRDTFHRVEYRDKEDAWSLRSYPTDNDMFTLSTPGSRARSPRSGLRSIRALEERKKQQFITARLSQPKQWNANMVCAF